MAEENWLVKVKRLNDETHELEGSPSYVWDQCGFWLSDTAVHEITLRRIR